MVGRLAMTLPSHVNSDDLYSAGLVGLLNAVLQRLQERGVVGGEAGFSPALLMMCTPGALVLRRQGRRRCSR